MQLLVPQTAAAQVPYAIARAPATLIASGLATTETVAVMLYNGVAYVPALDDTGTAIKLTATKYHTVLASPGDYRFDKSATAAVSGLVIKQNAE